MQAKYFFGVILLLLAYSKHLKSTAYDVELAGPIILSNHKPSHGQFRLTPTNGNNPVIHDTDLSTFAITNFQSSYPPTFSHLDPLSSLPAKFNFGRSRKEVRCTFSYNGGTYSWEGIDTFFPYYSHQGKWDFPLNNVDYNKHETLAHLVIWIQLEDSSIYEIRRDSFTIKHKAGPLGAHHVGRYYFDGYNVYLRQYVSQTWTEPKSGTPYQSNHRSSEEDIPTHKGSKVIYVEPIPLSGQAPINNITDYEGEYDLLGVGTIPYQDRKPYIDAKRLIYSDGLNFYPTNVTEEVWIKNNWQVGFGIVSYKDTYKLKLNPNAYITGVTTLPDGLYYKEEIQDNFHERIEKWTKLEPYQNNTTSYTIEVPHDEGTFQPNFIIDISNGKEAVEYLSLSQFIPEIPLSTGFPTFLPALSATIDKCKQLNKFVANVEINNLKEAQNFAAEITQLATLQIVKLKGREMGEQGFLSLVPTFPLLTGLTALDLKDAGLGRWFRDIENIRSLTALGELSLENNNLMDVASYALIRQFSYLTLLKSLNLSNIGIIELSSDIESSFSSLSNLESFNSAGTALLGSNLLFRLASLTQIQSLTVEAVDCRNIEAFTALRGLKMLKELHLLGLHYLSTAWKTEIVAPLASFLPELTNLESLSLAKGNHIIQTPTAQTLGQALQNLTKLRSLNLEFNLLGSTGISAFAPYLRNLTNLESINLNGTEIDDNGIQILLPQFASLTRLKFLDLGGNKIGTSSIPALENWLKNMPNLFMLTLRGNKLQQQQAITLLPYRSKIGW